MTSTSTIQIPQQSEGRTVRDVVEYQHELVNEAWCRKIIRQVLLTLEAQYAAQSPHRAITPDTIAFQDSGEPMLLPSPFVASQPSLAADLRALAAVIHYAITLELAPEGPLRGRGLEGYSDSLLGAVDRCLATDAGQRPQTIDELRDLLGIVAVAAPAPARQAEPVLARRAAPALAREAEPAPAPSSLRAAVPVPAPSARRTAEPHGRTKRWLLIGLAALVLAAAAIALVAMLRGTASGDAVALSLPPAAPAPQGFDPNQGTARSAPAVAAPAAVQPGAPAVENGTAVPAAAPRPAPAADEVDQAQPENAPTTMSSQPAPAMIAPDGRSIPTPRAAPAAALITYKLQVRPWATVYVDGDERGVSPPLKRLALAPGQHTVRLVNPNFPDRVIRIDAGRNRPGTIAHDFSAR